jgi:hypothetical protein
MTPSLPPSALPSIPQVAVAAPSANPTQHPSILPSAAPTAIIDPYPANPVPDNPEPGYFNYDTSPNARYGPGYVAVTMDGSQFSVSIINNQWGAVASPSYPYYYNYWDEFGNNGFGPWKGVLAGYDIYRNRCNDVGKQSPIDVKDNGAVCHEFHEIRTLVSIDNVAENHCKD